MKDRFRPCARGIFTESGTLTYWNVVAGGRVVGKPTGSITTFYLTDMLGSTRAVFPVTGTVQEVHDYYPFGLQMPGRTMASGSGVKEKFTGKERDAETGLDYFGARYYMPVYGRWAAVDPLADAYPAWSPYDYGLNNPLRLVDPDGRAPTPAGCPPNCKPQAEIERFWHHITERTGLNRVLGGSPKQAANLGATREQQFRSAVTNTAIETRDALIAARPVLESNSVVAERTAFALGGVGVGAALVGQVEVAAPALAGYRLASTIAGGEQLVVGFSYAADSNPSTRDRISGFMSNSGVAALNITGGAVASNFGRTVMRTEIGKKLGAQAVQAGVTAVGIAHDSLSRILKTNTEQRPATAQ